MRGALLLAVAALALAGCEVLEPVTDAAVIGDLAAVEHGTAGFVAVGGRFHVRDDYYVIGSDSALVARSPDGRSWALQELPYAGTLLDLAQGGGTWVAVGTGSDGRGVVVRSEDGVAWSAVAAPELRWRGVAHQNGIFLAVGYDPGVSRAVLATSSTGTGWRAGAEAGLFGPRLAAGGGLFLLYGEAGWIAASADGEDWEVATFEGLTAVTALDYHDGAWSGYGIHDCCFGEEPARIERYRLSSQNGLDWVGTRMDAPTTVVDLARTTERWVGITGARAAHSTDGLTWTEALPGADPRRPALAVAHGGGTFVAVGRESAWWSADGVTWTAAAVD